MQSLTSILERSRRTLVVTAFATCISVTASASHAADHRIGSEFYQKAVSYGDLNLAAQLGVQSLYRRIASAALEVCRPLDFRSPGARARTQVCVNRAIERAVIDVDAPMLSALHAEKTRRLPSSAVAAIRR